MLLKSVVVVTLLSVVAYANPQLFRSKSPLLSRIKKNDLSYRLPNNTRPLHYSLELETDIHKADFDFQGLVTIQVIALEATDLITLQSRQLTINKIELMTKDLEVIDEDADYQQEDDVEFLVVSLPKILAVDEIIIIRISYSGVLRDDNKGFYYSSYLSPEKTPVYLATTQFESVEARHAFPCFDEPGIRATFDLQIKHHKSYTAISNSRSSGRTPVNDTDYVLTKFQTTPSMQTYLLAFIISDFTFVQSSDHRVFAKKQSIAAGDANYALENGKKLLRKMEEHFGVNYSLPKMDQVAVPDFDAGAMENWGLVTYREEGLLYNTRTTSQTQEYILTTIAHEFAHQFFGNLVSPKWWSYLWLNEGFATLYGNYLADLCYPEERLMETFVVDLMQSAFRGDEALQVRAMTHYVESPEDIDELFDQIAYLKSGSVLRMLQLALSVPTFTKGIGYYLQDNAFKSVEPEDLYKALQRAADEDEIPLDIKKIMTSWELQSGFPLVTVSRDEDSIVTLKQERFSQTTGNTWWIPINYVVGSNPDFTSTSPDLWMEGEHQKTINGSLALKPFTVDDWMIFNIQQTSYYRVNYDDNLWMLLIHQLSQEFEVINVVNRAQLVEDSFSLADADYITYSIPFEILKYLVNETDYIPWASASRNIKAINSKLTGTRIHSKYQRFTQLIVNALYNKLGVHVVPDEHKLDRYARIIAINLACKAGMTRCLTDTADELQKMIETNSSLAPDVTASIYCHGLRGGSDAAFMFMLNKMQYSEDPAEREMIIEALGCSQNPSLLRMYLYSVIAPGSPHESIEKYHILKSVVHNGQLGLELTMEFLRSNHQLIYKEIPQILVKVLEHAASSVTTEDQFKKLTKILNLQEVLNHELLNIAQKNLDWIAENMEEIEDVLNTSCCLKSTILIIISSLFLMFSS